MTKRVTAALMAALVIMMTTYNAYTVSVNAAGIVIDGGTALLGDALTEFLATFGVSIVGSAIFVPNSKDDLINDFFSYCNTTEGSSALKDYTAQLEVIDGGGGSDPEPPEDPTELFDAKISGLVLTKELFDLASGFFEYLTDPANGSELGAAINEATSQNVYFVNPVLPEGIYIGFNSSIMPNVSSLDGYDTSLAHIQYYSNDLDCYVASQVDNEVTALSYGTFYHTLALQTSRSSSLNCTVYSGTFQYMLDTVGNMSRHSVSYPALLYTGSEVTIYDQGNIDKNIDATAHPIYLAPTNDQAIFYYDAYSDRVIYNYLVYPSGAVSDGTTLTQPSGVTTAEDCLTSVKPIVDMDLASFVKVIGKAITEAHPDEAPVLTPEAISQIYNNVSNVYDNAVTNYNNNPSYIDQSQYITNITNVYEQAIADNPAVDIPSVPTAGLGSLNNYKVTGLSDVFPFCIPFDMYDLMSVLAAEPKAISFDYTFYFGEYFDEYTLSVDLSVFDPVAKVVRTTELILYIFGLMLVTRSLIRG